jgi:hypothetical protein
VTHRCRPGFVICFGCCAASFHQKRVVGPVCGVQAASANTLCTGSLTDLPICSVNVAAGGNTNAAAATATHPHQSAYMPYDTCVTHHSFVPHQWLLLPAYCLVRECV